jgi:prolyl-tRNA editing enzyme YbaK/EbsC (Cys-tRNA(Pro) deacylase)
VTSSSLGRLELEPYRPELVADPVAALLASAPDIAATAHVVAIDPALADTQALNEAFGVDPDAGANCVVVMGRRGEERRPAACVVLSSTRADVNGLVRRTLDVRKCSFAPQDWAVGETGMEHGGITPVGLPSAWPILVDRAVTEQPWVVVGSGLRRSKLVLPGAAVARLPGAQVLDGLGLPPA